jgi:hypothetical protein
MRRTDSRVSPKVILPILITVSLTSIIAHQSQRIFAKPRIRGVQIPVVDSATQSNRAASRSKNGSISVTFVLAPFRKSGADLDAFLNLSVSSWTHKGIKPQFLVFENQKPSMNELERIMRRHFGLNLTLGPRLDTDEVGLAYVDDYVQKAVDLCHTDFLCFLMEDTILPKDFASKVKKLNNFYTKKRKQFAMVGNRCQIYAPKKGDSVEDLARDFVERASLSEIDARDNSAFSHDFILISMNDRTVDYADIPPFHLGMYWWDVWMVGWLSAQIPVVSIHGAKCGSYHVFHYSSNTQREIGLLGSKIVDNMELGLGRGGWIGIASKLDFHFDGSELKQGERVIAKL